MALANLRMTFLWHAGAGVEYECQVLNDKSNSNVDVYFLSNPFTVQDQLICHKCALRRMGISDFLERYLESKFGGNESEELSA